MSEIESTAGVKTGQLATSDGLGRFRTRYRIVRDAYAGYEVQHRYWWCPFWVQTGFTNTHMSVEKARSWANNIRNNRNPRVVEYLPNDPNQP